MGAMICRDLPFEKNTQYKVKNDSPFFAGEIGYLQEILNQFKEEIILTNVAYSDGVVPNRFFVVGYKYLEKVE